MATNFGNSSDIIGISTNLISNTNYGETLTDNVLLVDSASVYDVFKENSIDTVNLVSVITIIESLSIKRISDDSLKFSDVPSSDGTYSNNIDPSNINVSDVGSANTVYISPSIDTIDFSDVVIGNITYKNQLSSGVNIYDTLSGIKSKDNTSEFKNALLNTVGTTEETLYTCTEYNAQIINISLANRYNGAITADVIIYRGGTVPYYIIKDLPIGISETFVINSDEASVLSLSINDEVRVLSSVNNTLDVYMGLVEI